MPFASISRGLGKFALNNAHHAQRLVPNVMGTTTFGIRTFASKKVRRKVFVLADIKLRFHSIQFSISSNILEFAEKESPQARQGIPRSIQELLSSGHPASAQVLAVLVSRPPKEEARMAQAMDPTYIGRRPAIFLEVLGILQPLPKIGYANGSKDPCGTGRQRTICLPFSRASGGTPKGNGEMRQRSKVRSYKLNLRSLE